MAHSTHSNGEKAVGAVHRASFVLRCSSDPESGVRIRLIDARSGISYPLAHLPDLPDLVRRLLLRTPPMLDEASGTRHPGKEVKMSRRKGSIVKRTQEIAG
ncbi:MAG: hypothetical protein ACOC7Y_01710 [Chloroflexota bacterium]